MKIFGYKLGLIETLISGLIFVLAIYWAWLKLSEKAFKNKEKKEIEDLKKDISELNLSFDKSAYDNFADAIFQAMSGDGTNESLIYNTFKKLKTNDDVKQLIVAFGIRQLPISLFQPQPMAGPLVGLLHDELDDSEMTYLNKILTDKNITFQF